MQRISTPSASSDHKFLPGDGGTFRGTQFSAAWCNAVQEEIAGFIESAGLELDDDDNNQLFAAFSAMLAAGFSAGTISVNGVNGGTEMSNSAFKAAGGGNVAKITADRLELNGLKLTTETVPGAQTTYIFKFSDIVKFASNAIFDGIFKAYGNATFDGEATFNDNVSFAGNETHDGAASFNNVIVTSGLSVASTVYALFGKIKTDYIKANATNGSVKLESNLVGFGTNPVSIAGARLVPRQAYLLTPGETHEISIESGEVVSLVIPAGYSGTIREKETGYELVVPIQSTKTAWLIMRDVNDLVKIS